MLRRLRFSLSLAGAVGLKAGSGRVWTALVGLTPVLLGLTAVFGGLAAGGGLMWAAEPKANPPRNALRNWWSLQPLPALPRGGPAAQLPPQSGPSEIDAIIGAKLREKGLTPNGRADARTVLRRMAFALTGLPPTPEMAERFLRKPTPKAMEELVDQLLASPHFGEHWGRHWLDVARFGEDDFSGTAPRPYPQAWRYRDWVVQALNADMPFDRFVTHQLAADLLPNNEANLAALGLLGGGPWYYGILQPPQARADERHDRVDTVTRGLLGLTVACARCHDHKYDPISAEDYYALAGVFHSTKYKEYPLVSAEVVERYQQHQKALQAAEKKRNEFLDSERMKLAEQNARRLAELLLRPEVGGAALQKALTEYLAKPEEDHPYRKEWDKAEAGTRAAAAQRLQEKLLAVHEAKRAMDEENKRIVAADIARMPKRRKIVLPFNYDSEADFNPGAEAVTKSLERDDYALWRRFLGNPGGLLVLKNEALEPLLPEAAQQQAKAMQAEVEELRRTTPPEYAYLMGAADHEEVEDLALNIRGNPTNLGPLVPRRFLTMLAGNGQPVPLQRGSGRLDLANAIFAQPIAARVAANRIWAHLFGVGLSRTPSNFGRLGDRPANPALLDYLAARLVQQGWSVKRLVREVVLSEVFARSSARQAGNEKLDEENRYLWRGNRRRLEAESILDASLAASGELEKQVGGASAPLDEKFRRRAVYARVSRFKPDETLALFDFPNPSVSAEHRAMSNVPPQRLFFLNSDFVVQRAGALAARVQKGARGVQAQVRFAYRELYQREPSRAEVELAERFLKENTWPAYAQVLLSSNEFLWLD